MSFKRLSPYSISLIVLILVLVLVSQLGVAEAVSTDFDPPVPATLLPKGAATSG